MSPSTRRFAAQYFPDQWKVEERRPGVFYIQHNGHWLRQPYFTREAANAKIVELGGLPTPNDLLI